jgi:hypothetical protein
MTDFSFRPSVCRCRIGFSSHSKTDACRKGSLGLQICGEGRLCRLREPPVRSMMPPEWLGKDSTGPMDGRASERRWSALLLLLPPLACSSVRQPTARDVADANDTGRTVPAASATERQVLDRVASLPSGVATQIGDATVSAEAPYTAASARTCRPLHITANASRQTLHRIACSDGRAWFFVPDIFRTAVAGAGE